MAARAAMQVPFRLPGGEDVALSFFTDAWLNFYIATNNSAYQQMQQRIQVDKNTVCGPLLATLRPARVPPRSAPDRGPEGVSDRWAAVR